jgi:predicted dehydrogenase
MVRIGIIGSGFGLYGLLPAFNRTPGCKVAAICGKKSERLLKYCESIGLKNIYTDWQEMLESENLDAVAIAVVPSAQYTIAKAAIKKGLNIFAEKPLAANLKQAKELNQLAKKYKSTTAVDFIFPEIAEWQKVKSLLEAGTYGKLKRIFIEWDFESYDIKNKIASWKTDNRLGGGALAFYFSHSLNYLEYFAGKIIDVKSLLLHSPKSLSGGEVGADVLIKFKKGVTGYAHISANSKGLNNHQLQFICEHGAIILENTKDITKSFSITVVSKGRESGVKVAKQRRIKNEDERVQEVKKIALRFIKACAQKKQMVPSFVQGLRAQELLAQIKLHQI